MTKEEIREIRRRHVDDVFKPENFAEEDGFEQYKSAAHVAAMQIAIELISKAYEDAAQTAETWGAEDDEPTDPDVAFGCLAAAIRARALADSISREGEE